MQLSVIIPTCNRKELLKETLNIIFTQFVLDRDNIEFIVVNDGKDVLDEFVEKYKNFSLKIIKNPKKGVASARNIGVQYSKGEIILFHDDDILPGPDYFKRHIEIHQKYSNIITIANWVYPEYLIKKVVSTSFGRYRLYYNKYIKVNEQGKRKLLEDDIYIVEGMATFSCCMKRSLYDNVGYFNENFEYAGCEDAEFGYRAVQKGYQCLYDDKNICYHNELDNFELRKWLYRQTTGIKGAVILCKLHPEGKISPHWFTNTPMQRSDSFSVKILKIKKMILSQRIIEQFLFLMVGFLEKIKVPDKILFRLYNALWLGHSFRSFREEYKKHFPK